MRSLGDVTVIFIVLPNYLRKLELCGRGDSYCREFAQKRGSSVARKTNVLVYGV